MPVTYIHQPGVGASPSERMTCSICGGTEFKPGPNGRMSASNKPPFCQKCNAAERDRIMHRVWQAIPKDFLKQRKALLLSQSPGIDQGLFQEAELALFRSGKIPDLAHIDRPNACVDIIICIHVLNYVQYDRTSFNELLRLTKNDGFLVISLPNPNQLSRTDNWNFSDPKRNGQFRMYGRDLTQRFHCTRRDVYLLEVDAQDPTTGDRDYVYFAARTKTPINQMVEWFGKPPPAAQAATDTVQTAQAAPDTAQTAQTVQTAQTAQTNQTSQTAQTAETAPVTAQTAQTAQTAGTASNPAGPARDAA